MTALVKVSEPISMVNIELPQAVSIPAQYVADKNTRLGLYRRLAGMHDIEEVDALAEEMEDRFGPLPDLAHNLLFQAKVKIHAEKAGLSSVTVENGQFALRFPDGEVPDGLPDPGPPLRFGKTALWMPFVELDDWTESLVAVLQSLGSTGGQSR
jgi:transcription-repair coupling factor (superfamily II helicase)